MKLIEKKYDLALSNQEKEFVSQIIDFFNDLREGVCKNCEECEDCPFFEGCYGSFGDDRPDEAIRAFFRNILNDHD